jgi:hypothetical protein
MKALPILLIALLLSGCGIPFVQSVATPTNVEMTATISSPTPTQEPVGTATRRAQLAATQTMHVAKTQAVKTEAAETVLTALAKLSAMIEETKGISNEVDGLDISQAELAFGPVSKTISSNRYNVKAFDPELDLKNFITTIKFTNPQDISNVSSWDYGLLFRNKYGDNQYRLIFQSDQSWTLMNASTWLNVSSGTNENLRIGAGETNEIWLIVVESKAYLFTNDAFVQAFNVKAKLDPGDVSPATSLETNKDEYSIEFHDFIVWSLP